MTGLCEFDFVNEASAESFARFWFFSRQIGNKRLPDDVIEYHVYIICISDISYVNLWIFTRHISDIYKISLRNISDKSQEYLR